jgi:hypothetical protein
VERSGYFFAGVLPIVAIMRLAERLAGRRHRRAQTQLRKHDPVVNRLLHHLCKLELALLQLNRLGGLTVFCLARLP